MGFNSSKTIRTFNKNDEPFLNPKTPEMPADITVCKCEDGYVNEPKPSNITTPDEVCSYKQKERR